MKPRLQLAAIPLGLALAAGSVVATEVSQADREQMAANLPAQTISKNGVYIVRMSEAPVAAYTGGIKGYRATKPKKNGKLDPQDPAVLAYADYLTDQHDHVLGQVGTAQKLYSYKYAYNGFAAKLTADQANTLRKLPGIASVTADVMLKPDTISTPAMLGLEDSDGPWAQLGSKDNAGEGVVVGIVDSGIWPENESFSDRRGENKNGKGDKLDFQQLPGWHGKCTPGEEFPASMCNQKLIGAQWFNAGFGGDAAIKAAFPYEYASARDADGHGTHTASTAAGNADVPATISGYDVGEVSGMAPRARISAYKVCWGTGSEGGCAGSDSVAAIDQAVIDGVDVLNFSISGSTTSFRDQVEIAFLYAADAGVFVAASAGNSGPGPSTVAHNSPWLTTVAAGTHSRGWAATVETGTGEEFEGVSLGAGTDVHELVYSANVAAEGADPVEATLCYPGSLDASAAQGKIVLCDRGAIARVDKSAAVAQAGGLGMILANVGDNSVNADFHSIPSIHVDHIVGAELRTYAQAEGATAAIGAGEPVEVEASEVAAFSSRGPALAGEGDLLKPDIMAPGVDIIAAYSPATGGNDFDALSGTSMSSPHMAGLGALMKQMYPDWSPAMIKSALMTTATHHTNRGNRIADGAFGYGAGFVQPNDATDPGLVYDAGWNDWISFLCNTGSLSGCKTGDPSDLNYPTIAIGALAGSQTVTRTVTNVGPDATYVPDHTGLPGIEVSFEPESLSLAQGESATYEVTFTNVAAPTRTWLEGAIMWTDGVHNVQSTTVLYPVEIAAPAEVSAAGTDGMTSFDVDFGYNGDFNVAVKGLQAATEIPGTVVDDPSNDINTALATFNGLTLHVVPAVEGSPLQRFALFNEYTDGNDDLDLYVFDAGFGFVGQSGSSSSAEQVDVVNPGSPFYYVFVHGWQTDGPDANYTLFSWSVAEDAGNVVVDAPASAELGAGGSISVEWQGLEPGRKYLGVLAHERDEVEVGRTVLSVTTE